MTTYQNEVLNEREKTHGDYADTAAISQALKAVIRSQRAYHDACNDMQRESLDMVCTKIARILSGDPNCKDSWADCAGYSDLISERL
jgi:translation elongation factor EF-Tu-like GTPase